MEEMYTIITQFNRVRLANKKSNKCAKDFYLLLAWNITAKIVTNINYAKDLRIQ